MEPTLVINRAADTQGESLCTNCLSPRHKGPCRGQKRAAGKKTRSKAIAKHLEKVPKEKRAGLLRRALKHVGRAARRIGEKIGDGAAGLGADVSSAFNLNSSSDAPVFVTINAVGKAHRVNEGGREYLVVPMTSIVEGVLNGSKGALFYPADEIKRDVKQWDNTDIVVYHPADKTTGKSLSMTDPAHGPSIRAEFGVGFLRNSRIRTVNGPTRLQHDGWFDVEKSKAWDERLVSQGRPPFFQKIERGEAVELSTGLFTDNQPAQNGSNHNGTPYVQVARNYRKDHLAVLPDQRGACSLKDGCGIGIHNSNPEGINQYTIGRKVKIPKGTSIGAGTTKQDYHGEISGEDTDGANKKFHRISFKGKRGESMTTHLYPHEFELTDNARPDLWDVLTQNSRGTGASCTLNTEQICTNCGGKGGTKGPCKGQKGKANAAKDASGRANSSTQLAVAVGASPASHKIAFDDHMQASKEHSDLSETFRVAKNKTKATHHSDLAVSHAKTAKTHIETFGAMKATTDKETSAPPKKTRVSRPPLDPAVAARVKRAARGSATHNEETEEMTKPQLVQWLTTNCGGKGSGRPGPCPGQGGSSGHNEHDPDRAHFEATDGKIVRYKISKDSSSLPHEIRAVHSHSGKDEAGNRSIRTVTAFEHEHEAVAALASLQKSLTTNHSGDDMKKTELVQWLTTNCAHYLNKADMLNGLDEQVLIGMKADAEAAKAVTANSLTTNCGGKSFAEMISNATPQEQATWNTAVKIEQRERQRLIGILTANTADAAKKAAVVKRYEAMETEALSDLVDALPPITNAADPRVEASKPVPLYAGSASPFTHPAPTRNTYDGTKAPLKPYSDGDDVPEDNPVLNYRKKNGMVVA